MLATHPEDIARPAGTRGAEDLTIVIANMGSYRYLKPCLRSIFSDGECDISYRVIVGFNGFENNQTPEQMDSDFPGIETYNHPHKLGYCRAINLLLKRKTGRYVLILDDDTELPKGALSKLVQFMDEHPEIGISGTRTINPDGSYQKSYGLMFDSRTEMINAVKPNSFWPDEIYNQGKEWHQVDWLNGHAMIVRSDVIDQVGGLDEFYYTFQCEADWCLRIKRSGWQVAYSDSPVIMHVGGQHSINSTFKSHANIVRSHINRYYFFRKHYGIGALNTLRPIMFFAVLFRFLRYLLVYICNKDRRAEAAIKMKAYAEIALLSFKKRPDALPPYLKQANELAETCQ